MGKKDVDPNLPLKLVCDACKIGLGVVLLYIFSDDLEKPICLISCTVIKAELNYSVINKEAYFEQLENWINI